VSVSPARKERGLREEDRYAVSRQIALLVTSRTDREAGKEQGGDSMDTITRNHRRTIRLVLTITAALALALSSNFVALANVTLTRISTDPYTNPTSRHATEVEPDTFSVGSTIVSAFQVGRFNDGGASNIGWSTSTDGGATWTNGFLPGITKLANPAGIYDRVSDASVAYDAKDNVWLISSLPLTNTASGPDGAEVQRGCVQLKE